jgi:hypothetical protein
MKTMTLISKIVSAPASGVISAMTLNAMIASADEVIA